MDLNSVKNNKLSDELSQRKKMYFFRHDLRNAKRMEKWKIAQSQNGIGLCVVAAVAVVIVAFLLTEE